MKKIVVICILLFTKQVISAQESIHVQDSIIHSQLNVSEVTIVGRKEGRKLFDIPVSSSQINSRQLRLSTVSNMKDLALTIPNMFMPDYGTKLTSPIYIRGIGSRINSPSIGLYVDGIPYFEKSSFSFDFSDISSIEVLRGPQGTLYGRNTMGGIINVTTKSPFTHEETSISITGANKGQAKASISDYRKISEHFGYGIVGYYQHNDGFFYNETLSDFSDRLNSGGGRIKLSYKKDRHEFNIVSNIEYSDQSGYPYMLLDTKTMVASPVSYNRESLYRRLLSSNGVSYIYTSPTIMVTSRTSHQFNRDHQGIDQDFSPLDNYYINQKEVQNMVAQEIEIRPMKQRRINWIIGTSAFYQDVDRNVKMDYFANNFYTDKYYDTPRYGTAIYGQAILDRLFTENLSLTVGVRYDIERAEMSYLFNQVTTTTSTEKDKFTNKLTHEQVTPKFVLQYDINNYGHIYVTATKGYKAGGFNTSFVTEEEKTFLPEFSWNYELGTKISLLENKLSGSAAIFYIDWKDQQVNQPLSTGVGQLLKNAAKSRSMGFEISATYQPINRLNLGIDYGYTNAEFIDYTAGEDKNFSSNKLPYVPEHTASARIDYMFSSSSSLFYDYITLAAQYSGVGGLYWNDKNSVRQDFYNLLNARVSISKNILTLAVWAKNITNTKYNAYYFEALGNSFIQEGRPFTMGVDLTVSF